VGLFVDHYSRRYFLTDYRVIVREGLFSKRLVYAPYGKIQNVRVTKSISEQMMDIGDIYMDTSGGDQIELAMLDVRDPEGVERMILQGMNDGGIGG